MLAEHAHTLSFLVHKAFMVLFLSFSFQEIIPVVYIVLAGT